jgi:integrase
VWRLCSGQEQGVAKPTRHRSKWRIRWTDHTGHRRSEVFDRYEDAELALLRHKVEVADVRLGHRPPVTTGKGFDELCDRWLRSRASQKRSEKDDRSIIERHLRPAFGSLAVANVDVSAADTFVAERSHLSPKTINNHLTLLISMLRFAVDLGWLRAVPRIKKPKVGLDTDYRYLRTNQEVAEFLQAAEVEGEHVYVLYATATYTGLRAGELAGLQWSDIDLDQRLITVRRSYHGPTKSGRVRHVPILDPLLPLLRTWRLRHPGRLVFTNRDGRMLRPSARAFQEVLHRVLDRAGFESPVVGGKRRWHVTFHGLRHTFASSWVTCGGDIFKLQKLLGHSTIEMTMRYAHLAPDAFVTDYDRLGSEALGASENARVVTLTPAH